MKGQSEVSAGVDGQLPGQWMDGQTDRWKGCGHREN